jgi:hypothetical protein
MELEQALDQNGNPVEVEIGTETPIVVKVQKIAPCVVTTYTDNNNRKSGMSGMGRNSPPLQK